MIMPMGYTINFLMIISAVFGHFSFPTNSVIAETTNKHITIAVTVKDVLLSIAVEDSFILAQEAKDKGSLLKMIVIRARSSLEVKQLHQMNLDIVGVSPDPECPKGEELFSGQLIIEAVVSAGQLSKLKKMGFEVTEIP
jgi:hypothetical protein